MATIEGTSGNDIMNGDAGSDRFNGNAGNDTINAGAGSDTLYGGIGNDTLNGEDGNDSLFGVAGYDRMYGGAGNDTLTGDDDSPDELYGGNDNDTLFGGNASGNTLLGGSGDDVISDLSGNAALMAGGSGNDTLLGGAGDDRIDGGSGNDALDGGSGNDWLTGGVGNDTLSGGTGNDTLDGGDGDDAIAFAQGDTVFGGAGDDVFTIADLSEAGTGNITITGGTNGAVGDTLKLGTLADLSTLVLTTDGSGSKSGTVQADDGSMITFGEIENIICFTPGTLIATPRGARPVETLMVGDFVVTRDHGLQPIRWAAQRSVPAVDRLAPVLIRKGVMIGQERDLLVSPQHCMLFHGYRAELLFGTSEVLISAKHLIDDRTVLRQPGGWVTYVHIQFDAHEVIFAEGAATESFHPGTQGLDAIADQARDELFAIFPELRSHIASYGPTARRCLLRREAEVVML